MSSGMEENHKDLVRNMLGRVEALHTAQVQFIKSQGQTLVTLARHISRIIPQGKKVMIMGNGGSAADAQHMAAEFVNRFKIERVPLPALSLCTDSSILTSIGNDYSFDQIFEKQVQALGLPGDVLIGISTSGNSPNILLALKAAREKGITTVALTGNQGGKMVEWSDHILIVPSKDTPTIQETHILAIHIICDLVDSFLFPDDKIKV
jgi:D-sedoheptulose 7-phosphate isomerase